MIIANQSLELALGLPVMVKGFNDGQIRACYPFKLSNISMLNVYLSNISQTDLYENFKDETKTQYMAMLFSASFRPNDDNELNTLLHSIDANNFAEIISDIKTISGIKDSNGEIDIQKSKESIDWNTAVNSIPVYTSTPHDKVGDLTLPQLNKTLELIGKKISYEYKYNTIGLVKEPENYITKNDYPLYCDNNEGKKHVTMSDIKELMKFKNGK